MATVTGISSISFVGTVVNDPTMQNLGKTDHSYYTYTNATIKTVATVSPANATNQTVTWSYVNNSGTPVSAIDASGNITFSGTEGIVTITARAQDTSSGSYNTTIKMSVIYPDYVFNITNSHAAVRTDSTGKKWVEYRTYSAAGAAIGDTKLELTSTLYGGTASTNYRAYNSSTNSQIAFANISSNGTSSSTYDSFAYRTTPLYGNLPKLNGTDYNIYAQRLGPYYIGYNVRVQDALSNLAVSLVSTTSGPTATTDGTYSYFYVGSTVVVQAALQIYGSQNIADIYDASANWIAGPEFTVTRLVGTYTVGGVSGLFLQSGSYYHRASITVNSYTATPTLRIQATSPDTINSGFNTVILRSVTGMNSITGTTTVQTGSTTTLASSVQPANAYNQSITWSSSNTAVATVNTSTGVVTGVSPGTATITAASTESASFLSTTTVTVTGIAATSISAISFTGSTPVRTTSTGLSVLATVSPANATNKVVAYTSSNTGVATVDASGIITPVAAGTTTITATASDTTNGTLSSTYSLTVYNPVAAISSVTRTGFPTTIYTDSSGLSIAASITTTNVADSGVAYSSSATGVATVNSSTGAVTIAGVGSVTLTATSSENAGVSSTTTFTVYNRVAAISAITRTGFPTTIYTDSSGMSISASITTTNVADSGVAYSSSETGVATVNASTGAVTIVGVGSVTLTATSSENAGVSSTTTFTVYNRVAAISSVTRTGFPATIYTDSSGMSISASITTANVADSAVAYSSSETGVATVNASTGAVTIAGVGSVTLTATSSENAGVSSTTTFTVYNRVAAISAITRTGFPTTIYTDSSGMSISASITTTNVADSAVAYSSSETGVATVNSSTGAVTIVGVGSVTLTATSSENAGVSSTTTFTVYNRVAAMSDITTSGFPATVYTTSTGLSISASVTTSSVANSAVAYSSSDTGVATIDSTGAIAIIAAGTTTLRAESVENSSVYKTYSLTVNSQQMTTITGVSLADSNANTLSQMTLSIPTGNQLGYYYVYAGEQSYIDITLTRSDSSTDNATFVVYNAETDALIDPINMDIILNNSENNYAISNYPGPGIYKIEASINGGSVNTFYLQIKAAITDITSTATASEVSDGEGTVTAYNVTQSQTMQLTITRSDINNTDTITFTILDTINGGTSTGISVAQDGTVTATTLGLYTIISRLNSIIYSSNIYIQVNATVAVTGISSTTLSGGTAPFYTTTTGLSVSASVTPANATNQTVSYSSSETGVATVNSSNGAIIIIGTGSTTITSTSADGSYTSTYALTVSVPTTVATTSLSEITSDHTVYNVGNYNDRIMYVGSTETSVQLYTSVQPENATNQAVTWKFYNNNLQTRVDATINDSGLITFSAGSSGFESGSLDPLVIQGGFSKRVIIVRSQPPANTNSIYSQGTVGIYKTMNDIVGGGTVAVTGISSTSLSGGTAPFYTTTTGLSVSATVQPANATNQTVSYSSSETGVATVNSSTGAITIVGAGSTTITSTSSDGSYTSTYSLTTTVATTGLTEITSDHTVYNVGNYNDRIIYVGSTETSVQLYTSVEPENATTQAVTWKFYASDTRPDATISATGLVTFAEGSSAFITSLDPLVIQGGFSKRVMIVRSQPPANTNSIYSQGTDGTYKTMNDIFGAAPATVAVTGISATSLSGGSAPFYTTTTGLSVSASVTPNNATNTTVSYSSGTTSVATVNSSTGALTIVAAGSTTITSTSSDGSYTSTYSLTVYNRPAAISALTGSWGASTVYTTSTGLSVSATVTTSNVYNSAITYSSSNTAVATVDTSGAVTVVGAGSATLSAVPADNTNTVSASTLALTVYNRPAAISALTGSWGASTVYTTSTGLSVSATVSTSSVYNSAVTYSSSNTAVATVNSSTGAITVVGAGSATLSAVPADNTNSVAASTLALTVSTPLPANSVTSMTDIVLESTDPMHPNQWNNASVTLGPANATDKSVTWTSSNSSILAIWDDDNVTQDVVIVAKGVGAATLRATSVSNTSIYKEITVQIYARTTGMSPITFIGSTPYRVGDSARVQCAVIPYTSAYPGVTWSSSNTDVITVDASGNLTGISAGTCVIYASSVGIPVRTVTYSLTVAAAATRVSGISTIAYSGSAPFRVNATSCNVSATVEPATATNTTITYTSSDTNIAEVSSTGRLTGNSVGTCTITATTADGGYTSTFPLTVDVAYIQVTAVSNLTLTAPSPIYANSTGVSVSGLASGLSGATPTNPALLYYTNTVGICAVNKDTGVVTFKAPGTANVFAVSSDNPTIRSAILGITVLPTFVALTGISDISANNQSPVLVGGQKTLYIRNGGILQLRASPVPVNATNNAITWASSSAGITVDASGLATSVTTNADTVITGTDASGNNKTVNVKHITNVQGVNLISLSVESPLAINTTSIASSGTYPENATYPGVTWSASPVGIVTIDQSGNVTGVAPGNTTIYATAVDNSGIVESYPITVSVPFVEITGMSQITYTGPKYLHVNETGGKISAYVMPANATNQVVAYTWSPLNLLSIDASGNITALASGTVTIYASATETNGITVHDSEYVLTIYAETVNITGIDCLVPDVVLDIGSTIGFRNPMLPPYATNNQVTWVSADPEIASVNENGTVTGVTRGTTNIIATSAVNGILNSSYEITISSVPVSDITPIGTSTSAYSMIATNTLQLSAQVVPSNAGNKVINWFVSDISLATIDASGILTAIAPGSIVVRASANDNSSIYRETTIIISSKPVTGISAITSPSNVRTIELNSTMTLSANVLPADATNKTLKWTSNLPSLIEIVDASAGTIRGKLISGTSVTITATTVEGNYRAFYNMTCVAIKVQDMDPITTSTGDSQMNNGDSLTLITQILPVTAAVRDYAWAYNASTTNALQLMQSVASFNVNTATVSALTPGYASFKATSGGKTNAGEYIVKTITIQVGEPVQSLTPIFYGISSVLQATQTKQVTTSIVPSSASQSGIFWSCSQTGAATISQTGVISVARFPTGKTFTITATPTPYNLDASGNIIAVSQTFTITIPVTGISAISPSRTTISVGENRNLNAYIQPINADNKNTVLSVVSATNNAGQAVVDTSTILYTNGIIIRGIAKGSAIIKIESAENAAIFSTLNITIV